MSDLQQSKNWDTVNIMEPEQVKIKYGQELCHAKFPYCVIDNGYAIIFELILHNGERVRAWLDIGNQYSADGSCWRHEATNKFIDDYSVVAWKQISE